MARATPRVEGAMLIARTDDAQAISVGTPAWYTWLEGATSFAFIGLRGRFTARKERRGRAGGYWKAYRKRAGVLHSVYLGMSSDLTFDRLSAAAATLAAPAPGAAPTFPTSTADLPADSTPLREHAARGQPPTPALPLLATKLHPPPARLDLVARPHLVKQVQDGLAAKLLLLAAPAGFGKTTLLAEWLAARTEDRGLSAADSALSPRSSALSARVAWVALDAADNDPPRFWRYVLTALDTLWPGGSATALAMLETPQPPPIETILTVALNGLSSLPADSVLVLDDYHLIGAAPIHEAMTFLLDHLPAQLHLIITTRADPPLPLTRLRARRQLAELRAAELRFTPAEAATFLIETMGLPLSADDIAAIETRTEGWITGLQFAALALRDRTNRSGFVQAFTGSNRFVIDYLADEVLGRLPAYLQTFVLHTAVLDRMCGPLCDAVLGVGRWGIGAGEETDSSSIQHPTPNTQHPTPDTQAYSQLLLEQLERANLFLIPLDDERQWYRYHHLFAEVLRQRLLSGAAPPAIARLHSRASKWFEQQGLAAEAIEHALASRDGERAAQLVEQTAPALLASGEVTTLGSWLDALPEQHVRARPRLGVAHCWLLAFTARFEDLEARLREVEQALNTPAGISPLERQALVSELTVLRTRVAFNRNEAPDPAELRRALATAPADDLRLRSLIFLALAHAERLHAHSAEAASAYAEASALAQRGGDRFTAASALVAQAELHEVQGQLHQAARVHQRGIQLATTGDGRKLPLAGFFHVGLGKQLREWNDLDAATQHLRQGIALGQQGGMQGIELDAAITLALVHHARGDAAEVQAMLDQAAQIAQTWGLPPIVLRVATFQARLALMRGQLHEATRWARAHHLGVDDELSEWLEIEYCTLARWHIAERRPDDALGLLRRLAAAAEPARRSGRLIEILALQALAFQIQGETPTALKVLARALALAAPEGYIRVFVDEGAPMAALLRAAHARRIMPGYVATLLAAFPDRLEARDLRLAEGAGTSPLVSSLQPLASLVEPLTNRELEVLRLVAAGRSNRQVADELIVAVGTVKAHLNTIFGKLGVTSRTQAIVRARELQLVEPAF
jgi:LuxR family maltose regulon positive regulatory protein